MRQKDTTLMPEEITAVDIVYTDACVITTDEEIFSEDTNMEDADEICDDTEEEDVTKPTTSDVGSALDVLQNLWIYGAETGT